MSSRSTGIMYELLFPLFRFKWRALLVLATILGLAVLWLTVAPRQYESEAKLFVRVGRENASPDPTVQPGEAISLTSSRQEDMNSIVEHLRSRAIVELVFDDVHAQRQFATPREREKALGDLHKRLYISSPRSSNVIQVWGKAGTPQEAQQTVAKVVDIYLDEHMRINRTSGSFQFFAEQTQLLKQQVEQAQEALRAAKTEAGLASMDGRRKAVEEQMSSVESQTHQATADLAGVDAEIATLQDAVADVRPTLLRQLVDGAATDGLADMQAQLFKLRIDVARLTPTHPEAAHMREQMKEVEAVFHQQEPDHKELLAALLAPILANRASLLARKKQLEEQRLALRDEQAELNRAEVRILEMQRDLQQLEGKYLTYLQNMERSRMDEQLRTDRISNVSIMQSASFMPLPISPRRSTTLILALFAGILAAIAVALVSHRLDATIRDCEDLPDELALAGLVAIPRLPRSRLAMSTSEN